MTTQKIKRDYSLIGPENKRAVDEGRAAADWYTSPIPRQRLKELMKRKNGPAIRDTIILYAALIGAGILAYHSWGTWWAIPAFFLYGVLYVSPGDSRWHECGHGTAFKTPWMNELVYQIASFMVLRQATPWRWSHSRHHTDTIIVGRDPEILSERPPIWNILLMQIFHLYAGPMEVKKLFMHAFGKIDKQEKDFIPASEYRKTFLEARIYVFIFIAVIAVCIYTKSIWPAMFVVLPTFYGNTLVLLTSITQHLGLYEDVLDHRLNTRTVYMNRIMRFLYWNMNYHIEHHMFPMVPYHALPKLHEEMKPDTPAATRGMIAALREVIMALVKQRKDPSYVIVRPLPSTARPYLYGVEGVVPKGVAESGYSSKNEADIREAQMG
jgi:fatty acid desaturase